MLEFFFRYRTELSLIRTGHQFNFFILTNQKQTLMKKITLVFIMLLAVSVKAQTDKLPKLRLQEFSEGYMEPLGIENAGDSRLFIVERGGKIWICDSNGTKSAKPFLNISSLVGTADDEQGLLGLAFDPDYSINGFFYVNYTDHNGDTHISRFKVSNGNPNKAKMSTELNLLTIDQPFVNHNGGCLRFGQNAYLYIALGDGGDAGDPFNNAQDPTTLLGKMLRIDVRTADATMGTNYSIPPTNPFVNTSGYRPEIWATGLRNPWRFSFDALNGDLYIGDVGQNLWEEINFQPASSMGGENYGWSCWEGAHFYKSDCDANATPATFPIAEYPHTDAADCSGTVISGFVYRGTQFPNMYGKLIYADFCTGDFRTVYKKHNVWQNRFLTTEEPFEYTSFGTDINGELYVTDIGGGEILHVVDSAELGLRSSNQSGFKPSQTIDELTLFPNPNSGQFTVEFNTSQRGKYTVTITNQIGQLVLSETKPAEIGVNQWIFSSDKFLNGIYVLQIATPEGAIYKKFSVQ